jgi:hypothetical protein
MGGFVIPEAVYDAARLEKPPKPRRIMPRSPRNFPKLRRMRG